MSDVHYEIIDANAFGRRRIVRFKQYSYTEPIDKSGWVIAKNGCGPTTLATILASFGFDENPVSIAKKMVCNAYGFLSSGYFEGLNGVSILYCLNKLIREGFCLEYEIVKINYESPEFMKETVKSYIKDGAMAIVGVGPHPNLFASEGHYIAITGMNTVSEKFYVANSWYDGDGKEDETYSYEQIVNDIYRDNFDFLMIRKVEGERGC